MKYTIGLKHTKFIKTICSMAMIVGFTLLGASTIKATTLNIQGGTEEWVNPTQNNKTITDSDFIGRYNLNYTGNINYDTGWVVGANNGEPGGYEYNHVYNDLNFPQYINLSTYKTGETQYYTPDRYGMTKISSFNSNQIQPNSSKATLSPSQADAKIKYAYLIWYTRDSGNLFGYYDDPVYLHFPNGGSEWIAPEHACIDTRYGKDTLLCLSADVTDYVKNAGYGTYGVANIPFWYQTNGTVAGQTAGGNTGGWQLIIVEESANNPVRAVKIDIGSTYAECQTGYTGTLPLRNGLKTRPVDDSSGQVFFTGFGATNFLDGNRYYISNTIYSNTMPGALTGQRIYTGSFTNNTTKMNSHDGGLFAMLETFPRVGQNATQITTQSQGYANSWDSYFCLGMAVDIAFPNLVGQQETKVNADNSIVTITGGYENKTNDSDTGVAGGNLVVGIDNELTPINSELTLTLTNGTSRTITGTYDRSTHKVTFIGVDLLQKGDKCSYKIECQITSTDDERYYNNDELSGYLYSNGAQITGIPVDKASSSESFLYLIIEISLNTQGTAIDGGTIKTSGTEKYYEYYQVGNYADKRHTTPITKITIPTKDGCQFMGYYTGVNGTGTQYVDARGNILSTPTTFTNDTTLYAYWTPGVYAVIDADTNGILFYEKYTVGFFRNKVLSANGVTYDATVATTALAATPTKTGNTFDGYFTQSDGQGTQYVLNTNAICMGNTWIKKDTRVYAKWVPKVYTIYCDKQGGAGGSDYFYEQYGKTFMYNQIVLTPGTQTTGYNYTGGVQYFTAPYTGTYYLDVLGAQGSSAYTTGGYGGRSYGCINLIQGETLYIYVGGAGNGAYGGWNGGSAGKNYMTWWQVAGGGGGTDIRRGGTDIGNRVIVAGGGGGSTYTTQGATLYAAGGNGGGTDYQPFTVCVSNGSVFTNTALSTAVGVNYATPQLGTASGTGGGGGYYGGRALAQGFYIPGGEGGTGYIGSVGAGYVGGVYYGVASLAGQQTGNGYASITRSNYTTQLSVSTRIDTPIRSGYTFMGYYTGANGTGQQIVDATGNIVVGTDYFANNATIYAYWQLGTIAVPNNNYIVHFNGNGAASGSMSSMVCNIGQTYQLPANAFIKTNYTFAGWSTSSTGNAAYSNGQYFNQGTFGAAAGSVITLYAVWKDAINPVITDDSGMTNISHVVDEIEYPWVNHSVPLSFSATDNVAVQSLTLYDSNGNVLTQGTNSVAYTVTAEGITNYTVRAVDTSGNTATLKVRVKIDYVAPNGTKTVTYDGTTLNVSIANIVEKLSGCKEAWVVTTAYNEDGSVIIAHTRYLNIANSSNINDGAAYNGSFILEDEYNYDSTYMTVETWIKDIAGNERKIGETDTIETFYLTGYVTRALGPAEFWKAGEAGYVDFVTGVYVDKVAITYPDSWTALDSSLGIHMFDYTANKVVENTEQDTFFIPVQAENGEYDILVTAEKNGHQKTITLPVKTDGNIIEDLRTRLRYNPEKYPLFKEDETN